MSLYYDAVTVLTGDALQGSLKSRIYSPNAGLKAKPAHVYALISECAKYDTFLKEVVDNAGVLAHESKLTPLLCLLLVHDHLFAKRGIAASASHPLKIAIERNKARIHAEFTKARLRRKCGSIEALKTTLLAEKGSKGLAARPSPRWVRVNTLRSSFVELQSTVFKNYATVGSLDEVVSAKPTDRVLYTDLQVPDLIALPPETQLTKSEAYEKGEIILQDKASCFPAQLLLGNLQDKVGDLLDGCAAPGNKTTHMAAITTSGSSRGHSRPSRLYACERDAARSKTLKKMIDKAGAKIVQVMERQDFLALQRDDERFSEVTHLLLDPSCSGSGILGREDVPELKLPADPGAQAASKGGAGNTKKRKRRDPSPEPDQGADNEEEKPLSAALVDRERLSKLAEVQGLIVEHAMAFPAAQRITYSTCSIHCEENEMVVSRLLNSNVARARGWRVQSRSQHPDGLKAWPHRGIQNSQNEQGEHEGANLSQEQLEGCIRCYPNDAEGTMGFFVVCFARNASEEVKPALGHNALSNEASESVVEDEWTGFSDDEV